MEEKFNKIQIKYEAQEDILDTYDFIKLDTRTLYQAIKSMLINTTSDCVKYECEMDSEMINISALKFKKEITEDDILKFKESQKRLQNFLTLAEISKEALKYLISTILTTDEIKYVLKEDMPELFEGLYYMIDIEDEVTDEIVAELSELYEAKYEDICNIINGCIIEYVENAEEYFDDIKERNLYKEFVKYRNEWKKKREVDSNE